MSEKPIAELLLEQLNYVQGEGMAMQTVFCSVLFHIAKLQPELAQAIKKGFSEAEELMTRQASKYDKAPGYVTHALRAIEDMRAAAFDGV